MTWWLPFLHMIIIAMVGTAAMLLAPETGLTGFYAAGAAGMLSIPAGLVTTRCYTRALSGSSQVFGLAFGPFRLFLLVLVAICVIDQPAMQQAAALLSVAAVLFLTLLLDAGMTMQMLRRRRDKEGLGG